MTVAEGKPSLPLVLGEGPLQWGRNLTVAEGVRDRLGARHGARMLQWGRNLTVAEGATPAAASGTPIALQWGRNLTVAEGCTPSL